MLNSEELSDKNLEQLDKFTLNCTKYIKFIVLRFYESIRLVNPLYAFQQTLNNQIRYNPLLIDAQKLSNLLVLEDVLKATAEHQRLIKIIT